VRSIQRLLILDRDGTLNSRIREGYLLQKKDIVRAKDFQELSKLLKNDFIFCIASNQACISKGLISEESVIEITQAVVAPITQISKDQIFVCPHQEYEHCLCRKPEPQLLLSALEHNGITPENAYFVGDSQYDRLAAEKLGINFYGVCWDGDCLGPDCYHTLSGVTDEILTQIQKEQANEGTF
jgi:D-glycero-D-manno-heptose 1,7-bisphosphate phosphatase